MTSCYGLPFLFFGVLLILGSMAAPNLNGECTIPRIPNGLFIHLLSNKLTMLPQNSRAYVTCDNGYAVEGPPDIICQNGSWPSPLPKCLPKKCKPPSIVNGAITSKGPPTNLIEHESSLTISCNNGYSLNGANNVLCLYGSWSPQLPSCEPRGCQSVLIENGNLVYKGEFLRSSVNIAHGQRVIISCNNGYKMLQKFDVICKLGKWSAPFPECKPESCIPSSVANGRILAVGKDINPVGPVDHGLTLSVVCDSDYVLHGEGALVCNKGSWSHKFPKCQPKFCLSSNVPHSKVLYEGKELMKEIQIKHRSSIFIRCETGYSLIGSGMLTCSYGHWSHNIPECIPKGCHAQTVLQGSVSYLEKELTNTCSSLANGLVSHQHSVTVSCLEGFHRHGTEILTCNYGNWSETFPKCQPKDCHVQTVLNGKVISTLGSPVSTVAHSQDVSIMCDEGYELPAGNKTHKIHCFYGNWTGYFSSCVSKKCMADVVTNGRVLFGGEELKFSTANLTALQVPHDHHVTVNCDRGFNLTGTTKLKCLKGKWSETFPTCHPSGCPLHLLENGVIKQAGSDVALSNWGRILPHGQSINIDCKTGYALNGVNNLQCLFGNWSAELPVCNPMSCVVIPVKNAHLAYADSMRSPFVKHGNFLQVTCDPGFTLRGSKKVKCSEGSWCSTFPVCEPDECSLKEVTNGIISVNQKDITTYDRPVAHHTILTVRCQQGFDLSGIPKVQCLNGKWSTEFPTCEGMTCKPVTIENGFLQVKSSGKTVTPDDNVSANETVEVKCNVGHTLKGETNPVQCKMGKWTHDFAKCKRDVFCNLAPANGGVVVIGKGPYVPGSTVKFKCDRPICELLGESSITCLEDGKWSVDESPFCDCGA